MRKEIKDYLRNCKFFYKNNGSWANYNAIVGKGIRYSSKEDTNTLRCMSKQSINNVTSVYTVESVLMKKLPKYIENLLLSNNEYQIELALNLI